MRPFPFGIPDWRVIEAQLDRYPHRAAEMDGATVHFLHVALREAGARRDCPTCRRTAASP